MSSLSTTIKVKNLGLCSYQQIWEQMKVFTAQRTPATLDELWQLEHHAVLTQGQAGKAHHILDPGKLPIIQSDRGGQVTYHGPGQLIIYLLCDLRRKKMALKDLISSLQNAVITLLSTFNISATSSTKIPGVYVNNNKLCSLGLKVSRGCTYHGLSLNVAMDLAPFANINPCGQPKLKVTQLQDLGIKEDINTIADKLINHLSQLLGYTHIIRT